jgi:hypothetical protein
MTDERHNPEIILQLAATLLSRQFGREIHLRPVSVFSTLKSVVVRGSVSAGAADLPETLIVKKVREGRGYDPDSPATGNAAHDLFNDSAATQFLHGLCDDPPLSPRFYAGDRLEGLIVLEDLGDGEAPNTADALQGNDPILGEQTLIEHAALLGKLHAATMGRREEYQRIRHGLGPSPNPRRLYRDPWPEARLSTIPTSEISEVISACRASFSALGIRPRPGIEDEIACVTASVEADPGPFLAYCKGDQNVAEDYIRRDSLPRLFDFDSGGFRHALIEGMPGCMTWGCQMRIPRHIQNSMEKAYQSSLALGYAAVTDDRLFYRSLVEAGARWNILHIIHRLPDALDHDYQRGLTTLRQQVVAWFEAFADLSEAQGQMQALGESARDVVKRLREIWTAEVCRLPAYPAFRDSEGNG